MPELERSPSRGLKDWRAKTISDAIKTELDGQKTNMLRRLAEAFEAYWPAFIQQIRVARNDAGHPSSIDPVSQDIVHASLLVFPELVKLTRELKSWIQSSYA
jgi:hypothetical protein